MYYLNLKKLKSDIKEGRFSEKDRYSYFLLTIFLFILNMGFLALMPEENFNRWDFFLFVSILVILYYSTKLCFKANGGNEGNDFIGKYLSINFVIANRYALLFSPAMILGMSLKDYSNPEEVPLTNAYDLCLGLSYLIICYATIYKNIKELRDLEVKY